MCKRQDKAKYEKVKQHCPQELYTIEKDNAGCWYIQTLQLVKHFEKWSIYYETLDSKKKYQIYDAQLGYQVRLACGTHYNKSIEEALTSLYYTVIQENEDDGSNKANVNLAKLLRKYLKSRDKVINEVIR